MNSKRTGQTLALAALLLGVFLNTQSAAAATASRTSGFVYDPASGLLIKEIIEPGDPNLCLVTEYAYDTYGNKTSVTTRNCNGTAGEAAAPAAGSDAVIVPRTTTSTYTYNADGSLTNVTSNALGHSESKTFEPKFGNIVSLTGPNNLTTSWTYDNWGRKTLETRADGTTTAWSYVWGNGGVTSTQSPVKYYITTTVSGQANPVYDYYDSLSRKVLSAHRNFANTDWIDTGNVVFDNAGRVIKSYLTYERAAFSGTKFSTVTYDAIGRAVSQTVPDSAAASGYSTASTTFNGLTTVVTNALGQTKSSVKNLAGQTASIADAQGNVLSYTYDAFGNLLATTDAAGNVTRLTYDARGRKIGMNDSDMGIWTFAYNALGELIRQVDAKGQTVTMTYDKLGRMLSRNEPDLISTWVYDTAANGKGKLASSNSSNGYSRTHTYDALGRPTGTTTIPGTGEAAMVVSVTYDGFGRVLTQTYPASPTHPTGFTVSNTYNADGYLTGVGGFWAANSMDAMGHLTQQTYGNGVVTTQVFDPDTGKLKQQLAGVGNAVQNTSYKYDSLGNLKTRVDAVNGLTETYSYDNLNRIISATAGSGPVNTVDSFSYNAIGNIVAQSKQDVTANTFIYNYAYTYNASGPASIRPHAVSAITGTVYGVTNPVYTYDANGSMLTGAGRNVTWTSFNMPAQMVGCPNGGATCSTVGFTYNPEHERVKETQADGSVVITLSPRYDTGLHFEKKTFNVKDPQTGALIPAVEYEHYLYAGGMMFGKYITTTTPAGLPVTAQNGTVLVPVIQTEYYTKDHLGSIVAITDQTGAVTQRLSFDVFGKRRYPNGAADPNGLLNNPDMYHGYTGHEMLDVVGLIHMNGRIFDPAIGRFLSADPTIQAPDNLQSFNRYTYGWNNPMAGTDPSGYSFFGDIWDATKSLLSSNVQHFGLWENPKLELKLHSQMPFVRSADSVVMSSPALYAVGQAVVTHFTAYCGGCGGAVWAGYYAYVGTGSLTKALKVGMVTYAITYASTYIANAQWSPALKMISQGMVGGLASTLSGGKFADGFKQGFAFAAMYELYGAATEYTDSLKLKASEAEGGRPCAYDKYGSLRTDGARDVDYSNNPNHEGNWLTNNGMAPEGGQHMYSPDSPLGRFVNATSKFHDAGNSWNYGANGWYMSRGVMFDSMFQLYSFGTMLPAAGLTGMALMGANGGYLSRYNYDYIKRNQQ